MAPLGPPPAIVGILHSLNPFCSLRNQVKTSSISNSLIFRLSTSTVCSSQAKKCNAITSLWCTSFIPSISCLFLHAFIMVREFITPNRQSGEMIQWRDRSGPIDHTPSGSRSGEIVWEEGEYIGVGTDGSPALCTCWVTPEEATFPIITDERRFDNARFVVAPIPQIRSETPSSWNTQPDTPTDAAVPAPTPPAADGSMLTVDRMVILVLVLVVVLVGSRVVGRMLWRIRWIIRGFLSSSS